MADMCVRHMVICVMGLSITQIHRQARRDRHTVWYVRGEKSHNLRPVSAGANYARSHSNAGDIPLVITVWHVDR